MLVISSCTKNEEKSNEKRIVYEATGAITGQDSSLCACCGGWKLIIDNAVLPPDFPPDSYRFQALPANSNINLSTAVFPLAIKFNWSVDTNICGGQRCNVIIDDIVLN